MSIVPAQNKAIVQCLFEEGWNGNLSVFDRIVAEGFLVHFATHRGEVLGISGAKEMVTDVHAALHGFHCRIEDMFAEQDRVAVRIICSGEGRTLSKIVILRLAGGRIAEAWEDYDLLPRMRGRESQP